MSRKDRSRFDKALREYCEAEKISGTLRITVKDEIQYLTHFGYANDEKKTEFSENSAFSFYSMSKPLCAIGLLKLKDKGLVDLDTHPKKYVPEAEGLNERVTIRHLLHHVSGVPDFEKTEDFGSQNRPGTRERIREHLKLLTKYPSLFEPNTQAMYANVNFVIPALIIENITGTVYADYMKNEVFAPLGMKTAVVDAPGVFVENRVQGYALRKGERVAIDKAYDWLLGAADIVGTVDDAYCLNKAYKNKLLLSEKTWEEVIVPSPFNQMGLGNTVFLWHGKLRINHNGGHLGFRTEHIQLPEDDFDIVFLSNSGYGGARAYISELAYREFYGDDGTLESTVERDKGYI